MRSVLAPRALAWVLAVLPLTAFATEARDWLERMNKALAERSYDGVFLHMRGGHAESMRILHRVRDGETCERLMSLDGSGREFVRRGGELSYVLPDQRLVLTEERPRSGGLLPTFPRIDDRNAEFYELGAVKRVRLMDRDARLIALTPRDPYRYGYRVWIDARTHMPLKTELYDSSGTVLERIAFASLVMLRDIPDETFQLPPGTEKFQRLHSRWVSAEPNKNEQIKNEQIKVWSTARLPQGFRLTQWGEQMLPGTDRPVSHLVFSDGLASVSVFIGAEMIPGGIPAPAVAPQGAASTVTTVIEGRSVFVVGEVPLRTARMIASQLRSQRLRMLMSAPGQPAAPAAPGAPAAPAAVPAP
jgi:sigma-E factor negative regulatory protein RseB